MTRANENPDNAAGRIKTPSVNHPNLDLRLSVWQGKSAEAERTQKIVSPRAFAADVISARSAFVNLLLRHILFEAEFLNFIHKISMFKYSFNMRRKQKKCFKFLLYLL